MNTEMSSKVTKQFVSEVKLEASSAVDLIQEQPLCRGTTVSLNSSSHDNIL